MTATTSRQLLASPLDIELEGRVTAAVSRARMLLGDPDDRADVADADIAVGGPAAPEHALRDLIDALTERLGADRDDAPGGAVHEQEATLDRLRHRYDTRFEALAGVPNLASVIELGLDGRLRSNERANRDKVFAW